ncbi:MAG: BON domain-containing protein [Paraburkholderia sp.]|jgi:hyperosmotically inducible protein
MQIRLFIGASVVVASLLSTIAYAQTDADSPSASAPAASDKKALRLQNRQTSKSVRRALAATKGLVSSNIAILVKGEVVTLVGTVPDNAQIQLAGDVTKGVPNVQNVDNRLILEEEASH